MAIRKVIEAGNSLLKAKNKPITDYKSAKTQKLIRDLIQTMRKTDLIGIAASQIGENYQVFVTQPRDTKARKLGKIDQLRVYINPQITFKSKEETVIYEGCGSLDNIFGPVSRPKEVQVIAMDEKGRKFSLRAGGILARVIQHEMDHLNGIEFIQKVNDYNKIVAHDFYVKNIRNSKLQTKNSLINKIDYQLL